MVGYLSKKPKLFVDDPGKLYRQRRRATQAKGLEIQKLKSKDHQNLQGNHHLQVKTPEGHSKSTRMEKMEIEKEAQHLKAAKARSTCGVFIVMKMLETQVGQLAGQPIGDKEEYPRQLQGPKTAKATQAHSGEMKDHTRRPRRSRPKDRSSRCRATRKLLHPSRPKDKASL
jgi:hypothetical protein